MDFLVGRNDVSCGVGCYRGNSGVRSVRRQQRIKRMFKNILLSNSHCGFCGAGESKSSDRVALGRHVLLRKSKLWLQRP